MLPYIFPNLHQITLIGKLKNLFCFLPGNKARIFSMLRQRAGYIIKGQTYIPRSINLTRMPCMISLMAAVTGSKSDLLRLLYNMACTLIVQNMVCLVIDQHRLLHIDAPQPGFRGKKQILYKILFHIHILPVELA